MQVSANAAVAVAAGMVVAVLVWPSGDEATAVVGDNDHAWVCDVQARGVDRLLALRIPPLAGALPLRQATTLDCTTMRPGDFWGTVERDDVEAVEPADTVRLRGRDVTVEAASLRGCVRAWDDETVVAQHCE